MAGGFAVSAALVAGGGARDLQAPGGWNMQNAADDETSSRNKKEIDDEDRVGIFVLAFVSLTCDLSI